jgi:hypothetical protein
MDIKELVVEVRSIAVYRRWVHRIPGRPLPCRVPVFDPMGVG